MAHAEKCPVCKGGGNTSKEPKEGPLDCHGCKGKGWVEVRDNKAPPLSDMVFVTNDPIIDECCANINKPVVSGGL